MESLFCCYSNKPERKETKSNFQINNDKNKDKSDYYNIENSNFIYFNNYNLYKPQKYYYTNTSYGKIEDFEKTHIGFQNIGNSCYMNSFLQILFHCPGFINKLKKEYGLLFDEPCLVKSLIDLSECPNNINCLKDIQKYMSEAYSEYYLSRQNDSQDFGKDLINQVIKSIKGDGDEDEYSYYESENEYENNNIISDEQKIIKYKNYINKFNKDEIFIETIFELIESEERITSRGSNIIFNTSLYIELFFPKNNKVSYTLDNLLNFKYSNNSEKDEYIEKKKGIKVIRKICRLPKILILNINRAIYGYHLINSKLNIPETLNLSNYIDNSIIEKNECTKYNLFAINEKVGHTKSNGHYFCYINIENSWYLFDDSYVIKTNPYFNSENVVGLFYIKKE